MTSPLFHQLRNPIDPVLRLKAAQALGEWDDINAVPLLIRAAVEDPDPEVRRAAQESLLNTIGGETDLALQTYRSAPDLDPWLVEEDPVDNPFDGDDLSVEEDRHLSGLVTVLRNHADPQMRLKAIQQLSETSDLRVIAALSETVLWTDDDDVREAARASLQTRFGEGTAEVIQSYQVQDDILDEEDVEENEAEDFQQPYHDYGMIESPQTNRVQLSYRTLSTNQPKPSDPVEGGFPWVLAVIGVVGLVALVIAIVLLVR